MVGAKNDEIHQYLTIFILFFLSLFLAALLFSLNNKSERMKNHLWPKAGAKGGGRHIDPRHLTKFVKPTDMISIAKNGRRFVCILHS